MKNDASKLQKFLYNPNENENIFLAVNQLVEGQFKNHETAFRMAFAPRMVASSP